MRTTALENPSTHQVQLDSDILNAFPFPACVFNIETEIVVLSNTYFNSNTDLPVLQLLNNHHYHFLNENDMKIFIHRIASEKQFKTQRFNHTEGKIYEIHISGLPNNNNALLFFHQINTIEPAYQDNQFFKNLFQKLPEGIAIIDEKFRIKFCNNTFSCFFNWSGNVSELIDTGNLLQFESELENQKLLLESAFELQIKGEKKDRFIYFHFIPQSNNKLKYDGSILILTDITDHVYSERELNYAKLKSREAENLKSTFLANISHEIRTPINCIIGFSSLLRKSNLNKNKRNQYIDLIISRGKQLLDIINNIIDITRIEENQISLNLEPCNLSKIFNQLNNIYIDELAKAGKQEIKFIVKNSLENGNNIILSDGLRLQQVLSHLLNNSIKFTEEGCIEVGCIVEDSENLLFYVKDTGIGIPKEKQRLIFDRFRQVDESFTRTYAGTGLGLAICEGILKLLHGKIWVESSENNGSVFYFTIPYYPFIEEKNGINIVSKQERSYNWENYTILIVEDDDVSYDFLNEVFIHTNCEIQLFQSKKTDLILLDIQLPEMDGFQIAKEIKKINASIPIIAQTAHAMAGDRQRCIEAGCSDYLSKPVQFELLLDTIDYYLFNK